MTQWGKHVLAVDGGGTGCRLALASPDETRVVEVGPTNVSSAFDVALGQLCQGLDALAAQAGLSKVDLAQVPAYLGLAGVTGAQMAARVAAALPLNHARVQDDRPAALRGALGGADGAIAQCGTGSFFALQSGGTLRLAGGWGARLGDEASAFWVARQALSATLEAVDGLRAETPLSARLLAQLGDPAAIVVLAATATAPQIAALAPLVTEAAADGDPMARAVMAAGATHIAHTLGLMGWRPDMALCLTGGIGPQFAPYLPASLAQALRPPAAPPLQGAIQLAREFAQEARQ